MSQATKTLVLYKRHTPECDVHKSRVPEASRRFWMECGCPIWIHGRTPQGDVVPRQSTGSSDLRQAEALRASLVASAKVTTAQGPTLAECSEKYLASREHELGDKTYRDYRRLLDRLSTYCAARGAHHIREVTIDMLETFKVAGLPAGMEDTTKAKSVEKVRCFLRDAHRRGWITEGMADRVKPHRAVIEQKDPFTDDEVNLILAGASKLNGGTHGYASQAKTFRLLLELMLETGMRVGDAIRFDPREAVRGEHLWVYTFTPQKQRRAEKPKTVEAFLSDTLMESIRGCDWLSPSRPFAFGSARNPSYLANEVYERMKSVGRNVGVEDCRPHRLRDTFAVRKLLSGLQLDDVSRLLGHSSVKVTEAYYAKWVRRRRDRLEGLVAKSLMNA